MNATIRFNTAQKHYVLAYTTEDGARVEENLEAFGPEATEATIMLDVADRLPPGEHVVDFHPVRGVNGKVVVTSRHKHARAATV